jgi:hypothetical protein
MLKNYIEKEKQRQQEGLYNEEEYGINHRRLHAQNVPAYHRSLTATAGEGRASFNPGSAKSGELAELDVVVPNDPNGGEDILQRARHDPEARKQLFLRKTAGRSTHFGGVAPPKPVPKRMNPVARPWLKSKPVDSTKAQHEYQQKNLLAGRPEGWVPEPRNAKFSRQREFSLPQDIDRQLRDQHHQPIKKRERMILPAQRPTVTLPNPNREYPQDFNPNLLNQKVKMSAREKYLQNPEYYRRNQWKQDLDVAAQPAAILKISEGTGRADVGPIKIDATGYETMLTRTRDALTLTDPTYADQPSTIDYNGEGFHPGENMGLSYTEREYEDSDKQLGVDLRDVGNPRYQGLSYQDRELADGTDNEYTVDQRNPHSARSRHDIGYSEREYREQLSHADFDYPSTHQRQLKSHDHRARMTLKEHHMANPSQGLIITADGGVPGSDNTRGLQYNTPEYAGTDRHGAPISTHRSMSRMRQDVRYQEQEFAEGNDRNTHLVTERTNGPRTMGQIYSEQEHADASNNKFSTQRALPRTTRTMGLSYEEREIEEQNTKLETHTVSRNKPRTMGQIYSELEYRENDSQLDRPVEIRGNRPRTMGMIYDENEVVGGSRTGTMSGDSRHLTGPTDLSMRQMNPRSAAVAPHVGVDQRGLEPKFTMVKQGMDRMKSMSYDKTIESREKDIEQSKRTIVRGLTKKQPRAGIEIKRPSEQQVDTRQREPIRRTSITKKKPISVLASPARDYNADEAERIMKNAERLGIPKFR